MVLAFTEKSFVKETYDRAGTDRIPTIKVYDRASKLERALKQEVRQPRTLDEDVAIAVWALGAHGT